MDEEREYRQKVMKIGSVSIGLCLLLAYWYATQGVAAECEYNPALGACLSFGDFHIYQPFQYYFWQQDGRIAEAIPEVLGGYAFYPYLAVVVGGGFTYLCTQGMKKETSHGSASFASKKEIDEKLNGGLVSAVFKDVNYSLTFHDCESVLTFNPENNHVVSLTQTTRVSISGSGKSLGATLAIGNQDFVNHKIITDIKY